MFVLRTLRPAQPLLRSLCTVSGIVVRPRRSVLYIPGINERAIQKSKDLPVDAVVLDLEDSVAPDMKVKARTAVAAVLQERVFGKKEVIVRINGFDTPWGQDDLAAIAHCTPNAILIPKVSDADTLRSVERFLSTHHDAALYTKIWAMMETAAGILNAASICSSTSRLECLVIGTEDLVKEMRAQHTVNRQPVLFALSMCVLAARAHKLSVLDGVYPNFNDNEGLRVQAQQALELGFDGKTVIHPKQVDICNSVFTPSDAAVQNARRIVDAMTEAKQAGRNVATIDGRMVEMLHAEAARRLIALHTAIGEVHGPATV